jgi:hypothetical protein
MKRQQIRDRGRTLTGYGGGEIVAQDKAQIFEAGVDAAGAEAEVGRRGGGVKRICVADPLLKRIEGLQ